MKIDNAEFEIEYNKQDNKNIINSATKKYSMMLSKDERVSCGMSGLWRCMQNHDPSYGTKFTTSLFLHVDWECKRAVSEITKKPLLPIGEMESQIPDKSNDTCLLDLLDGLNESEKDIIHQRFVQNKTLEEIGITKGYTKEAARQNINKAIKNLKKDF